MSKTKRSGYLRLIDCGIYWKPERERFLKSKIGPSVLGWCKSDRTVAGEGGLESSWTEGRGSEGGFREEDFLDRREECLMRDLMEVASAFEVDRRGRDARR